MTVKGTLIATLAAGYFAAAAPALALAGEDKAAKPAEGEKAGCKGKGGCGAGHKKGAKKKEAKAGAEAAADKPAEKAAEKKAEEKPSAAK
jgi:hypothetical protein